MCHRLFSFFTHSVWWWYSLLSTLHLKLFFLNLRLGLGNPIKDLSAFQLFCFWSITMTFHLYPAWYYKNCAWRGLSMSFLFLAAFKVVLSTVSSLFHTHYLLLRSFSSTFLMYLTRLVNSTAMQSSTPISLLSPSALAMYILFTSHGRRKQ